MKREIRDKRKKLLIQSMELRTLHFDPQCNNQDEILEQQDKLYKKWSFYDNMIKASEKVKKK